jgi:hypothetical protein
MCRKHIVLQIPVMDCLVDKCSIHLNRLICYQLNLVLCFENPFWIKIRRVAFVTLIRFLRFHGVLLLSLYFQILRYAVANKNGTLTKQIESTTFNCL